MLELNTHYRTILHNNDLLTNLWCVYSHSSSAPQCCDNSEQTFCRKQKKFKHAVFNL